MARVPVWTERGRSSGYTTARWIGTDGLPAPSMGGHLRLRALLGDGRAVLSSLSPGQWQAWASTLLAFLLNSTAARRIGPRGRLLARPSPLPHRN